MYRKILIIIRNCDIIWFRLNSEVNILANFFNTLFTTGFLRNIFDGVPLLIVGSLICIVSSYLLGSINFAIIISGKQYKQDIRQHGSGNAGMTNMMRTYGKGAAALTLLGDALKAVAAGLLGYACLGLFGAHLSGLFCVIGHMFPIFYKFKGGKGVVTTAASILMCNPYVFLVLITLFIVMVAIWRYISLASVMCVLLYPVVLNGMDTIILGYTNPYGLFTVAITVLVVFKHKDNIKRLMNGTESKFSFKKSVKKEDIDNSEK